MGKKSIILISIFSVIFLAVFGFCLTWTIINWDKVKTGMSGTGIYTKEDLDNASEEAYNKGVSDKLEYEKLINEYRDTITNKSDEISFLNRSIKEKNDLIVLKENLISELNSEIDKLNLDLDSSNTIIKDKDYQILLLNNQIDSLNVEIIDLKNDILNYKNNIDDLEKEISDANKSLTYYKNFISGLETSSQAVATFIYDNSVYSVLLVQKGSKISIDNPIDSEYIRFNGWYVNGVLVDLNTYILNENTTFTADVDYSFNVVFTVDDTVYSSQIIADGSLAETPAVPSKVGYEFVGWSVNGSTLIDLDSYSITRNTTFIALFTKVHTVSFEIDGDVISQQSVKHNDFVNSVNTNISDYIQFNYWTLNGVRVDITNYPITEDVVFIADFTRKYDVTFMYEDTEFSSQIVLENSFAKLIIPDDTVYKEFIGWSLDGVYTIDITNYSITKNIQFIALISYSYDVKFMSDGNEFNFQIIKDGMFASVPSIPTKTGYVFDGWSLDGSNIIDVSSVCITENTVFTAVFTKLYTVKFNYEDSIINSQTVRSGDSPSAYSVPDTDRVKFNGWTLDGSNIVDITSIIIEQDITFNAVVTYCHLVNFIVNSQLFFHYVEDGGFAVFDFDVLLGDYTISGWKVNNTLVDISTYPITKDTTFTAELFRYKFSLSGLNNTNAYSVKDNMSTHGVYILNFSLADLMSFTDCNAVNVVCSGGGAFVGGTSINGGVVLSQDGKIGISASISGGGFSIYIYDSSIISSSFIVTLTPTTSSNTPGL